MQRYSTRDYYLYGTLLEYRTTTDTFSAHLPFSAHSHQTEFQKDEIHHFYLDELARFQSPCASIN